MTEEDGTDESKENVNGPSIKEQLTEVEEGLEEMDDVLVPADEVLDRITERQKRMFEEAEDEDEPLVPEPVLDAIENLAEGDTASKEEIEEVLEMDEFPNEEENEIDGFVPVDEQIRMEKEFQEDMAEPDFELGDKFEDDHDERVYRVVHRMQNYDDPADFLYALSIDDADIPHYQWHGEDWIHEHYERIEQEDPEEIEDDEEGAPDETTD